MCVHRMDAPLTTDRQIVGQVDKQYQTEIARRQTTSSSKLSTSDVKFMLFARFMTWLRLGPHNTAGNVISIAKMKKGETKIWNTNSIQLNTFENRHTYRAELDLGYSLERTRTI